MPRAAHVRIARIRGPRDVRQARRLIEEYARSLAVDLCFQGFDEEMRGLPGKFVPPSGGLWLAWVGRRAVGCVALRRFDGSRCEMKRLYVRPRYRDLGIGRRLVSATVRAAERAGYRRMLLDTLGSMRSALRVYASFGFRAVRPYRYNPIPGAVYLALSLRPPPAPLRRPGGTAAPRPAAGRPR